MSTKQKTAEQILTDVNKKFVYVLAVKNPPRGKIYDPVTNMAVSEREFPPTKNILFRSSIVWKGGEDPFTMGADGKPKNRPAGKYFITYYDGCTTLFQDDQPKDRATIENLIASTRDCNFNNGYFEVMGYDTMKRTFMDWASFNENSQYRIQSIEPIWKTADMESQLIEQGALMDMEDTARDLAKSAKFEKMKTHAKYLGIEITDRITGEQLSETALRAGYRRVAKQSPKEFIDSYNDTAIEIKIWIQNALDDGNISTSIINGMAAWKSGVPICEITGITQLNLIVSRIAEFAKTEASGDTVSQLKAIYG